MPALSILLYVITLEVLTRYIKANEEIKSPYNLKVNQCADDITAFASDVSSMMQITKEIKAFDVNSQTDQQTRTKHKQ